MHLVPDFLTANNWNQGKHFIISDYPASSWGYLRQLWEDTNDKNLALKASEQCIRKLYRISCYHSPVRSSNCTGWSKTFIFFPLFTKSQASFKYFMYEGFWNVKRHVWSWLLQDFDLEFWKIWSLSFIGRDMFLTRQ